MGTDPVEAQARERRHADQLGLAVPARLARPRARIRARDRVPVGLPSGGAQARQVVAAGGAGRDDRLDRRADDERAGAVLPLDHLAEHLRVDPAHEHVRAAGDERGEGVHQRSEVKQRAAVQVHVLVGGAGEVPVHEPLIDARGVAQHRAVRSPTERGGVHDQHRRRGVDRPVQVGVHPARQPRLVPVGTVVVVRDPPGRDRDQLPRRSGRRTDLLVLPHHHPGPEIVDDERQLLGALTPVDRAAARTELRRREQQLQQPKRVLPHPHDPVTRTDAVRGEDMSETVHATVERLVVEPGVAVDRADARRSAPGVLAEHVADRQRVEDVQRVRCPAIRGSSSAAARSADPRGRARRSRTRCSCPPGPCRRAARPAHTPRRGHPRTWRGA